jgi:hypothetical protein
MRFCSVDSIGIVCDTFTPTTEMRRDEEVRVLVLTLRIEPLTLEIAAGIEPLIRRLLFRQGGEPVPHLRDVIFAFDVPRQLLKLRLTPEGRSTMAFDQVKIGRLRAKQDKAGVRWSLIFKATFGPVDRNQLEYAQAWFGVQRFVTFVPAEADLFEHEPPAADDEPELDGAELAPDPAEKPRVVRGRRARVTAH